MMWTVDRDPAAATQAVQMSRSDQPEKPTRPGSLGLSAAAADSVSTPCRHIH